LIANDLGVTRNTVIGKAHRLKLARRGQGRRPFVEVARRQSNFKRGLGAQGSSRAMRLVERKKTLTELFGVLSDDLRDLPHDTSPCAKTIIDMIDDRSQCRWPVNTPEGELQLFCADTVVPNKPYCLRHCHRAYEMPKDGLARVVERFAA